MGVDNEKFCPMVALWELLPDKPSGVALAATKKSSNVCKPVSKVTLFSHDVVYRLLLSLRVQKDCTPPLLASPLKVMSVMTTRRVLARKLYAWAVKALLSPVYGFLVVPDHVG